jgi:predicted MFS family arabinose efflux permease
MDTLKPEALEQGRLSKSLLFLMAASGGVAVASIYYNQPLLSLVRDELGERGPLLLPAMTQIGYATGLFLLLPLGDKFERRTLIVLQFLVLAAMLLAVSVAPSVPLLALASFALGASATVAQQLMPFAAHLAAPKKRGATVVLMMSGLVSGIILSRAVAGFVGSYVGWRTTFMIAAPLDVLVAVALWFSLPKAPPHNAVGYFKLVASLPSLWTGHLPLRRAALIQAALFGSFSVFWSVLSLRLQDPGLSFGPEVAGIFGLVGAIGVFSSPYAGRLADKRGTTLTIRVGIAFVVAAWVIFFAVPYIAAMLVAVVLLDIGVQICLVSNQHDVFSLGEATRARMNTILMGIMFIGGAAGSGIAGSLWETGGWLAVCIAGMMFAVAAAMVSALTARRRKLTAWFQ